MVIMQIRVPMRSFVRFITRLSILDMEVWYGMDIIWIFLIILLVALILAAIPTWPHSREWGYNPVGALAVVLIIILVIFFITAGFPGGRGTGQSGGTGTGNGDTNIEVEVDGSNGDGGSGTDTDSGGSGGDTDGDSGNDDEGTSAP